MPKGQHLRNYHDRKTVEETSSVSITSLRTLRSPEFKTFFEDKTLGSFGESELKLYQGMSGPLVDVLQLKYFRLQGDPVIRFYRNHSYLATTVLVKSRRGYYYGSCSQCEKGVRNLFIMPTGFLCFKCADLIYASSKKSAKVSVYENQFGTRINLNGYTVHESLLGLRKKTRKERFKIYQQESKVELKEIF